MHSGYHEGLLKAIRQSLHDEFHYLREKNAAEPEDLPHIIYEQMAGYDAMRRHVRFFENNKESILGAAPVNMHREDVLVHFLTTHDVAFTHLLKGQLASSHYGSFKRTLAQLAHKDLPSLLDQEETLFSAYLTLAHERAEHIDVAAAQLARYERHERMQQSVLYAAAGITAVPLGPLEVLSLPFWATYFSLKEIEEHKNSFEEWRRIKKPRIIKK